MAYRIQYPGAQRMELQPRRSGTHLPFRIAVCLILVICWQLLSPQHRSTLLCGELTPYRALSQAWFSGEDLRGCIVIWLRTALKVGGYGT